MTILTITLMFFVAVLLMVVAISTGYYAVKASPAYELKRRLRKLAVKQDKIVPSALRVEILGEMSPADRFFYQLGAIRRLDLLMDRAGVRFDVKMFSLTILAFGLAGVAVGLFLPPPRLLFAAVLFFVFGSLPVLFLLAMKKKRYNQFLEQFPGALDMIGRSLKAGHSFTSAVQMVGSELSEPVSGLFKTAYDEQTLGLSMKDALAHMAERMDSIDLRFFVTAVNIHREIGGNLSEILERLAHTIRERITIRRQVKVYTAQARLSGYILAVLPLVMAVILYFIAPKYIGELVSVKMGKYFVAAAFTAQIIGFFVIRRIINIRI